MINSTIWHLQKHKNDKLKKKNHTEDKRPHHHMASTTPRDHRGVVDPPLTGVARYHLTSAIFRWHAHVARRAYSSTRLPGRRTPPLET
jgi:hypothetical protein